MSDDDDDESTETIVESLVDVWRRDVKETKREDGTKEEEKKKKNVYVRVCCICV